MKYPRFKLHNTLHIDMAKFEIPQRGNTQAEYFKSGKSILYEHILFIQLLNYNLEKTYYNYLHNRTKNLPFLNRIPLPPTHPQFPLSINSNTHFHLHTLNNHNCLP